METIEMSLARPDALAQAMKAGKVVVFPTDTVYGLLAVISHPESVRRVFEIKGRAPDKPLPLFVSSIKEAKEVAEISSEQESFLSEVWPGKATCILLARHPMPEGTEKEGRVALRVPNHPFLLSVLREVGEPVTATSANLAGHPPVSDSAEFQKFFEGRKERPDILVVAGILAPSLPSTLVDMTRVPYCVLRQGALHLS